MAQPLFPTPFSNNVCQINVVAEKVAEKVAGSGVGQACVVVWDLYAIGIPHVVDGAATFLATFQQQGLSDKPCC